MTLRSERRLTGRPVAVAFASAHKDSGRHPPDMVRPLLPVTVLLSLAACRSAPATSADAPPVVVAEATSAVQAEPDPPFTGWLRVGETEITEAEFETMLARLGQAQDPDRRLSRKQLLRRIVDQQRILQECERIEFYAGDYVESDEKYLHRSVVDVDAALASRGQTLETFREASRVQACFGEIWDGRHFPDDFSDENYEAFYEANKARYTADSPWVEFVVVTYAHVPKGRTGNPTCDAYLDYVDAFVAEQVMLSEKRANNTKTQQLRYALAAKSLEHQTRSCQQQMDMLSTRFDVPAPAGPFERVIPSKAAQKRLRVRAAKLHAEFEEFDYSHDDIRDSLRHPGEYLDTFEATPTGQLDPGLAALVSAVEEGDTSAPIFYDGTYVLVRVEERHPAGVAPFYAVYNDVVRTATDESIATAWAAMWRELAKRYPVEGRASAEYRDEGRTEYLGLRYR